MAKPTSFNKRELEKKREQKRQEKQKRKEVRKANVSGSFDDMIAYVDENGVISNTPPDPMKKQEIEIENIAVSTPKKEDVEEVLQKGRVEYFNPDKGYGFIKDAIGVNKYFFHISSAPETIREGNNVTFELERGPKGMNAVRVLITN
ncbi:MAG: cold shock domain-containing protein [Tannerellaceae bacterium]|jgi:cold shock CspA family protein|nr:cold shock domain-containing protein [Tannerellaceae bacterium]